MGSVRRGEATREERSSRRSMGRPSRARRGLLILGVLLIAASVASWLLFQEEVKARMDALLLEVGLAWLPLLLWLVAFLTVLRRRPRRLLRQWNRWLGSLLLAAAVVGGLSSATLRFQILGYQWVLNLGGEAVGGAIAGPSPLVGALRLIGLAVAGGALIFPRRSWRTTRGAIRLARKGGRLVGRAYRRFPIHRGVMISILVVVREMARGLASLWLLSGRARRPKPRSSPAGEEGASLLREVTPEPQDALITPPLHLGEGDQPLAPEAPLGERAPTSSRQQEMGPTPKPGAFQGLPRLDLLRRAAEVLVPEEVTRAQAERIEKALAQYGIDVTVQEVRPGPTVTLYGLVPGWVRRLRQGKQQESERRVTVDAILAREKDLALALAAPSIRFEAPVPGESMVGVEVPNPEASLVTLGSLMGGQEFHRTQEASTMPVALGKGSGGEVVTADLTQMPHLLIAGATGSGKSVMVNALLVCLLMQLSPWELRLILVDPKRVELTHYNGIPHLVTPVVVEADRAVKVLRGAVLEMTHRLRLLEDRGCRNIATYNQRAEGPLDRMPYLVVVVDEMADLMLAAPNDIEYALCRLAQLGRATGIHLVVATQRPSVDIITGLIKANFPSRISFAVTSHIDSKTILDTPGAEKLLGRGDMLFLPQDLPKPKRVQGAFVSDDEMHQMVEFWSNHEGPLPPPIILGPTADEEEIEEVGGERHDELRDKARELAQRYSRISTSLLQRRLRIGYPRAARLREELESEGVISADGEVLLSRRGEGR